jgi:hypothetical protein
MQRQERRATVMVSAIASFARKFHLFPMNFIAVAAIIFARNFMKETIGGKGDGTGTQGDRIGG